MSSRGNDAKKGTEVKARKYERWKEPTRIKSKGRKRGKVQRDEGEVGQARSQKPKRTSSSNRNGEVRQKKDGTNGCQRKEKVGRIYFIIKAL